jgi:hypothetical protein
MNGPFDMRAVVVCDDIRREQNGKALIIGVYGGDIVLPDLPATLTLAFYFVGKGRAPGHGTVEIRIQYLRGKDPMGMATATADVQSVPVGMNMALALPGIPFDFDRPTELIISVLVDGEWCEIDRKQVLVAQRPPASASEQSTLVR